MDVRTEADVIRRLKHATSDSTVIVITHRTSLLNLVDRVIVLEGGKIVADGSKGLLTQFANRKGRHLNVAAS